MLLTQPGDGHLNPLVPVAQTLIEAGHEVVVATSPSYVLDVERAGLTALGFGPPWRWDSAIESWPDGLTVRPEDTRLWAARCVNRDIASSFVADVHQHVRDHRPDVVIAENAAKSWAQAVHDLDGVPYAVVTWAQDDPVTLDLDLDEGGFNQGKSDP
jgi:hypothetical protein